MNETCKKLKITLHLTHLKSSTILKMNRLDQTRTFDVKFIYPSNHDAVLTIINEEKEYNKKNADSLFVNNHKTIPQMEQWLNDAQNPWRDIRHPIYLKMVEK